jgi:flavin-binding protein dodecin
VSVDVEHGKVTAYRVTLKLTFVLESPKKSKKDKDKD